MHGSASGEGGDEIHSLGAVLEPPPCFSWTKCCDLQAAVSIKHNTDPSVQHEVYCH